MYDNYRVVAVTPAGRKRYLELLSPYIINNKLVDEWRLWVNTNNSCDIDYMKGLASDKIKLEYGDPAIPIRPELIGYSIHQYFRNCCDPNTIYIRFDDDICHIDYAAIENLLLCRLKNQDNFLVFANIINNSITSHLYQRFKILKSNPIITYNCVDKNGWDSGEFAEHIHRTFLIGNCSFFMNNWDLNIYERFSINCFAFFGRDFASFGGHVDANEEIYLAVVKPRELQRPNLICGDAIVNHYAFYTQRPYLDGTDIMDRYRQLSIQLNKES